MCIYIHHCIYIYIFIYLYSSDFNENIFKNEKTTWNQWVDLISRVKSNWTWFYQRNSRRQILTISIVCRSRQTRILRYKHDQIACSSRAILCIDLIFQFPPLRVKWMVRMNQRKNLSTNFSVLCVRSLKDHWVINNMMVTAKRFLNSLKLIFQHIRCTLLYLY